MAGDALDSGARAFFAPGRANLLGAHLDYNGGCVMPVTVSKGTCILLQPRSDRRIVIQSSNFRGEAIDLHLDELRPGRASTWSAYIEGAFYMAKERWPELPGMDVFVGADLPMARGLSSSSSVQCAALFGLAKLLNAPIATDELIRLAHRSEIEYVGVQSGPLDPTAIFLGKPDTILHYDCWTKQHENLPLPAEEVAIAVMDSGVERELASSSFNERVAECASAFEVFRSVDPALRCMRDVTPELLGSESHRLSPATAKRAQHVVSEVARTERAVELLRQGELAGFGAAMSEAHQSLRDFYEVSTPELDVLVQAACSVEACYGSRLTGAGFGGCTVALLHPSAMDEFAKVVPASYKERTGRATQVMFFRPAGGPEEWPLTERA